MVSEAWVKELAECSSFEIFSRLQSGVEKDIAARNDLSAKEVFRFKLRVDDPPNPNSFTVLRLKPSGDESGSVFFTCEGRKFWVVDESFKQELLKPA